MLAKVVDFVSESKPVLIMWYLKPVLIMWGLGSIRTAQQTDNERKDQYANNRVGGWTKLWTGGYAAKGETDEQTGVRQRKEQIPGGKRTDG